MQRRKFMAGLLLLGGGVAGHYLTLGHSGQVGTAMDPKAFAKAMQGVRLQYLSQDLLLKLFSRRIVEADRPLLTAEIVNHNRHLFVQQAYERQHGAPGFYRVIE